TAPDRLRRVEAGPQRRPCARRRTQNASAIETRDMNLREQIDQEIAANKILVYGKGTKDVPRCGFTLETIQFFDRLGYPFEVVDVLEDMPKREALAAMTDWPTLPKIFINGTFYGDTDILGPMAESGELQTLLKSAFDGAEPASKQTINLH